MSKTPHRLFHEIISGSRRGPTAGAMRLTLSFAESFYRTVVALRNHFYDRAVLRTHHLGPPVISIGNLTAGGTGKTPLVRWLCLRLRERGARVAVLSRGYKSGSASLGDEQVMLDALLNDGVTELTTILKANPDRVAAAAAALKETPDIDLFLLDDGFQHRRVARDLDVVLVNATEPFGHGHALPRGLLREPIAGLRRAGAVVITHADAVEAATIDAIERRVRQEARGVRIYRAMHSPAGLRTALAPAGEPPNRTMEELRQRRFFMFCGIGSPQLLDRQLRAMGEAYVGARIFPDHHVYSVADMAAVHSEAAGKGADLLVTTEKDWVKVARLHESMGAGTEIWRLDVQLQFAAHGADELLRQIDAARTRRV